MRSLGLACPYHGPMSEGAGEPDEVAVVSSNSGPGGSGGAAVVVVPVKAFSQAKMRLAAVLRPEERAALARKMAEHVLAAAVPLPVVVVCDDEEVGDWPVAWERARCPSPASGSTGR